MSLEMCVFQCMNRGYEIDCTPADSTQEHSSYSIDIKRLLLCLVPACDLARLLRVARAHPWRRQRCISRDTCLDSRAVARRAQAQQRLLEPLELCCLHVHQRLEAGWLNNIYIPAPPTPHPPSPPPNPHTHHPVAALVFVSRANWSRLQGDALRTPRLRQAVQLPPPQTPLPQVRRVFCGEHSAQRQRSRRAAVNKRARRASRRGAGRRAVLRWHTPWRRLRSCVSATNAMPSCSSRSRFEGLLHDPGDAEVASRNARRRSSTSQPLQRGRARAQRAGDGGAQTRRAACSAQRDKPVVAWEPDKPTCSECDRVFTKTGWRRRHCRLVAATAATSARRLARCGTTSVRSSLERPLRPPQSRAAPATDALRCWHVRPHARDGRQRETRRRAH